MKKNILVVDDSALMRRVICDIINSDSGFQATDTCRDGLEAYEKLCQKAYDAVVLDVNMPRMNGLELLERLQKENIKATVVMVSTLTTDGAEVTLKAMERGAIDFIEKPNNLIETKGQRFREKLIKVLATITAAGSTQTYQKKVITNVVKPAAVRKIRTGASILDFSNGITLCKDFGPPVEHAIATILLRAASFVLIFRTAAGFTTFVITFF